MDEVKVTTRLFCQHALLQYLFFHLEFSFSWILVYVWITLEAPCTETSVVVRSAALHLWKLSLAWKTKYHWPPVITDHLGQLDWFSTRKSRTSQSLSHLEDSFILEGLQTSSPVDQSPLPLPLHLHLGFACQFNNLPPLSCDHGKCLLWINEEILETHWDVIWEEPNGHDIGDYNMETCNLWQDREPRAESVLTDDIRNKMRKMNILGLLVLNWLII